MITYHLVLENRFHILLWKSLYLNMYIWMTWGVPPVKTPSTNWSQKHSSLSEAYRHWLPQHGSPSWRSFLSNVWVVCVFTCTSWWLSHPFEKCTRQIGSFIPSKSEKNLKQPPSTVVTQYPSGFQVFNAIRRLIVGFEKVNSSLQ